MNSKSSYNKLSAANDKMDSNARGYGNTQSNGALGRNQSGFSVDPSAGSEPAVQSHVIPSDKKSRSNKSDDPADKAIQSPMTVSGTGAMPAEAATRGDKTIPQGTFDSSTSSDIVDSSGSGHMKRHTGSDCRWEAIQLASSKGSPLSLVHFRLLKRLGYGDIGSVYLVELRETDTFFAMKVMDKEALISRNKLVRAETERQILGLLDHPFLSTLYTHFETEKFYCLVMEYCCGGNLHSLRQKQPNRHFNEQEARFYAAEVLLALEYLHMLGIVYRDLKPENVLVRDGGHIMLSDFDLSLRCSVSPMLVKSSSINAGANGVEKGIVHAEGVNQGCIQSSAFFPRILPKKNRKTKSDFSINGSLLEFNAEPTDARSLRCSVSPMLVKSSSINAGANGVEKGIVHAEGVNQGCIQSSAFFPRILPKKNRKTKSDFSINGSLLEFNAEPTDARSMSFVGTHEYLAPEIIKGLGHGSAVDWWTFGIFLYELLHGMTPFKGNTNRATLCNVVDQPLRFPDTPPVSNVARDLIRGLLVKDPQKRIATKRGATEIKQHPFFDGVNWALVRGAHPPSVPDPVDFGQFRSKEKKTAAVAIAPSRLPSGAAAAKPKTGNFVEYF